jgi:methionyl-tRNA synthetase
LDFDAFLRAGSTTEMHHFLGKDIINFHGLFWPAMLHGAGFRTPTRLHVNGYLMVNGAKMSKSRGTFVMARTYLDSGIEPEALRYYFATRSSGGVDDLDLNLEDFVARVNSDLVGKFVNLASRASGFASKHFDGALERHLSHPRIGRGSDLVSAAQADLAGIRAHYARNDFASVAREAMRICDSLNQRWDSAKPWLLAKDELKRDELQQVCSECLLGFYVAACALLPILPQLGTRALRLFGREPGEWDALVAQLPTRVLPYEPLLTRIDPARVAAMVEASREDLKPSGDDAAAPAKPAKEAAGAKTALPAPAAAVNGAYIGIEDFARVDLRVGEVLECSFVEGSDKLLRFRLDAGELGERQIFSGIRAGYPEPEKLLGRKVVFIANLAPRKMRFGLSEGMILSAGGDDGLFLLDVDAGASAGMSVK